MRKMFFVLCVLMGFAFGQPLQDGIAAYKSKDYDKAIRNFTEAIRLNPDASAYYNRGIAYMAKGDNARAIADFEAVLKLSPSHDKAKSSLELARQRQSSGSISAPATKTATVDELDISIRDASDYLNEKIPKGSKIVILNIQSNSSDLSDYIIDELIANAVNDGFYTVVDRQQLDAIRAEQKFQLSGAVDDKDALAIGKLFGAQTIVSGAVSKLGATGYRIRIRALEVQTAQVQGQFNRNIAASSVINSLMANGGTASSGHATVSYSSDERSRPEKLNGEKEKALAEKGSPLTRQKAEADKKLEALRSKTINVYRDARGTIISLSDVLFEFGRASLKQELKENLAEIAVILKSLLTESKVDIEGHTDNVGSAASNKKLSEQRAKAVLDYLVDRGVDKNHLKAVGYGLTRPVADNSTAEGRAKNRRVELVIFL